MPCFLVTLGQTGVADDMHTQLIVNLFGPADAQAATPLFALIHEHQCQALDSRLTTLDDCTSLVVRLTGNWDRMTRLETALDDFARRHQLTLNIQRNPDSRARARQLPYVIDAIGLASAGVAAALTGFCSQQGIVLHELSIHAYHPPRSTEQLVQLRAQIDIPADLHIGRMKNDFFDLCDHLNLDAAIEPDRSA